MSWDSAKISDKEVFKIKLALSSLSTSVILCPMVTSLYKKTPTDEEAWCYVTKGVLSLITNRGADKPSIQIALADPDSGFLLWSDTLSETSEYVSSKRNFHTFKNQQETIVGFRFPFEDGANIFLHEVSRSLKGISSSDEGKDDQAKSSNNNNNNNNNNNKNNNNRVTRTGSLRRTSKSEISVPIMFSHVSGFASGGSSGRKQWKSEKEVYR